MRLLGIFLLFCISIGTVSSFRFWNPKLPSSWITSVFANTFDQFKNEICSDLANNSVRVIAAIKTINETLEETDQTRQIFSNTITYLNSQDNQMELIDGTSTCLTYFSGMYNALVADLKNLNLANAKNALDSLINCLNQLKSSTN